MELTELDIYLITRCSYVKGFFFIFGILFLSCLIIAVIVRGVYCDNGPYGKKDEKIIANAKEIFAKKLKKYIFLSLFPTLLFVTACFIPTTKEMCAIKIIPIIANNEQVQDMPNKIVELANSWMEELKPSKKDPAANKSE
jgi:hypothetical protein